MSKVIAQKAVKKINFDFVKGYLSGLSQFYGFYKQTVTVSFTHKDTGLPIKGLTKTNFSAVAVQTPSSWVADEKLKISNVKSKSDGVYTFLLSKNGKDLQKGKWTVVIKASKIEGKTKINDQIVVNFSLT
jgi:hypothetical protein